MTSLDVSAPVTTSEGQGKSGLKYKIEGALLQSVIAEKSVTLDIGFNKKLGVGLFGGEGFIMQRITGPGLAFLEFDGEIVEYSLQPNRCSRFS